MFLKELEGTLMELRESPDSRYQYEVWFDYTRDNINRIQEGTLLGAPNFAGTPSVTHYSVLEVVRIHPIHYALVGGMSGYPGFVVEAARSAAEDWETQQSVSSEDTTKIRAIAIPTNLEIIENPTDPSAVALIGPEQNMAMVGTKVKVLGTDASNRIANHGIDRENERNLTAIGQLARDKDVEVLLRIEDLLRTHFAIFGFTGVGKSNLLSTLVSKLFSDSQDHLKLVFYDLMSEYTVLLLDQLLNPSIRGGILIIGRHTLPEGVYKYINDLPGKPTLDEAARQLQRYTLLPKELMPERSRINEALKQLLDRRRIKVYSEAQSLSVFDLFFTERTPWGKERRGGNIAKRSEIAKTVLRGVMKGKDYKATTFSPQLAKEIREGLEKALESDGSFSEDYAPIISTLRELERSSGERLAAGITLTDLVSDLNDKERKSLWVVQAHNPSDMRVFTKRLGEAVYEERRLGGLIEPLVSFVFDEADEFIRREGKGSYEESAEIAETLARRGRKFGLGIGIATQRIRYLDTNIMSQPNTYLVSKLPRLSDRQAVAEGFGVGEDIFLQTFKFKKGQWLLMSHSATGIEAIPMPIQMFNANKRIADWLMVAFP